MIVLEWIRSLAGAVDRSFRGIFRELKRHHHLATENFFFRESAILPLLAEQSLKEQKADRFIDYGAWANHYANDSTEFPLKLTTGNVTRRLPYCELINFIRHPQTRLPVVGTIPDFSLPEPIRAATHSNEEAFLRERPRTTDGPVLRMAGIRKVSEEEYRVTLQRSSYFAQVRTNLSLDFGRREGRETLRVKDLGPNGSLKPLEDSILVNSIGVSAVLFADDGGERRYFMKLRRAGTGVYPGMLAGIGGAVQPPAGHSPRMGDLLDHARSEILREISEETGLPADPGAYGTIAPLALLRELTRGGKPQFFFLVEVPSRLTRDFRKRFRRSAEGRKEFQDRPSPGRPGFPGTVLAPELVANLLYALSWFQARQGLEPLPVHLG